MTREVRITVGDTAVNMSSQLEPVSRRGATQIKVDACGSGFRCVDAWSALSSEKAQQQ